MSIGQPTLRVEGPVKVTGRAKYAADHYPPGALHAVVVGSPVAAGRVRAISTTAALAVPGVIRVMTSADAPRLVELAHPIAVAHFPLQSDEVQWEGQAIAVVIAETLEAAEEAAGLVTATIDAAKPLVPGGGRVETPPASGPARAHERKGNLEQGFTRAAVRVEQSYFQPTRHHNPMETSACVARWDGEDLTVWDATQFSQNPRRAAAQAFGISLANVRVVAPHTGGGFGSKAEVFPHVILAAQAARLAGRPVRLQLTRAQMYSMTGHQAECRQTIALGATKDGVLTAVRHHTVNTTSISDTHVENTGLTSRTYYASPAIAAEQQVERINLIRPCPLRSPVEGPGSWALESAMDELARELDIDPLDLRLRNFADVEPMEGKPWSSNKLREAYAEAAEVFGWRRRHEMPRQDGVWSIGRGMSTAGSFVARFPNKARVRVRANGSVLVESSSNDIGTGNQTVAALVAAEALGVSPSQVSLSWGDTRLPAAGPIYGSSHTMGLGTAVRLAALDARRKLASHGAATEGPLDLATLMERANISEVTGEGEFAVPGGAPISFNGSGTHFAMGTWGANFVEVGVDRDLGLIRLRRFVGRYSAGRIINPLAASSQMIGGVVWEWGKATMEASIIEPRQARFLAKNLSNVAVPVNADIPHESIDVGFLEEFDPHASAIGARGIGELSSTGVAAAIANAIYDAVGIRVREVPILPKHILDGLERGDRAA